MSATNPLVFSPDLYNQVYLKAYILLLPTIASLTPESSVLKFSVSPSDNVNVQVQPIPLQYCFKEVQKPPFDPQNVCLP